MALKRIQKELIDITKSPTKEEFSVFQINNNPYQWQASIKGPQNSPYDGGIFPIFIQFNSDYPFRPPTCCFLTQILHPNINTNGLISLDILQDNWSPALTISKVLQAVKQLLNDPNFDSALNPEASRLYQNNKQKYTQTVKQWVQKYSK